MKESIILGIVQNTAILLSFSMLYDYFWSHKEKNTILFKVGTGIILGSIGIVLILTPWHFVPGVFFDTRSVILSVAGLFFGAIPTIIAMIITGLYRFYMGGAGVLMGIAVVFTSGTIGLLWRYFSFNWRKKNQLIELAGMGILVHIVMLSSILLLPTEIQWETLKKIALPVILIYPVATVLLGALLLNQAKIWENRKALRTSEKRFRTIIEQATDALFIADFEGNILDVNQQACKSLGYTRDELLKMKITDLDAIYDDKKLNVISRQLTPYEFNALESEHRRKDASTFPVDIKTSIIDLDGVQRVISFVRDITERKQSEQKIIRMAQHYQALIEKAPDGIVLINKEGNFKFVSPSARKMFGYSDTEEIVGNPSQFTHPDDLPKVLLILQNLHMDPSLVSTIQHRFVGKNGMYKWIESTFSNLLSDPSIEAIVINFRDITDRKNAEEKLASERKLLRTLIDNLPATIYVKDAACRKIIANRLDLDFMGVKSEKEVLGKTDFEIFNNEIAQRGYSDDLRVINTGQPVINREEIFYDESGALRWLLTSKIPLTDENEKIVGLVGIGREITEQKLAQEKILKLSKGIEQSPVSIEITDNKGYIEYVNPKFCDITGYSCEEIIGKHARTLKSDDMPKEIYNDLWDTISSGNVWHRELLNRKKDSTLFWESVTITSIKNDKNFITNYIAIKEDITERKNMQAELIEAKERAEESDRLKSTFLANMSHEIRTPMNSIIGFSELLSDPDFDQEQKNEFIRTIIDNGNSLLVIISDIMDFSMLEACQMKIRKDTISTNKLLNELVNDFSKKAIEKGIEIRIDHSLPISDLLIESDLYRIKQIFNNLISNALKFTNTGYIGIGYKIQDELVEFHVNDTGIGIAPECHQTIFERFSQIDTANTRKYGGNGLGLAISKKLVKLLGGNIWIASEPDKYSNFFFTIPINTNQSSSFPVP